jgi:hypothetical protein
VLALALGIGANVREAGPEDHIRESGDKTTKWNLFPSKRSANRSMQY